MNKKMKQKEYEFKQIIRINRDELIVPIYDIGNETTDKSLPFGNDQILPNIIPIIEEILSNRSKGKYNDLKNLLVKKINEFDAFIRNKQDDKLEKKINENKETVFENRNEIFSQLNNLFEKNPQLNEILDIENIKKTVDKANMNIRTLYLKIVNNYDEFYCEFFKNFIIKLNDMKTEVEAIDLIDYYFSFIYKTIIPYRLKIKNILNDNYIRLSENETNVSHNIDNIDTYKEIEMCLVSMYNDLSTIDNKKVYKKKENKLIKCVKDSESIFYISYLFTKYIFNLGNGFFIKRDLFSIKKVIDIYFNEMKKNTSVILEKIKKEKYEVSIKEVLRIINEILDKLKEWDENFDETRGKITNLAMESENVINKVDGNVFEFEPKIIPNDMEENKLLKTFYKEYSNFESFYEKFNNKFTELKESIEKEDGEIRFVFRFINVGINDNYEKITKELENINFDLSDGKLETFYELHKNISPLFPKYLDSCSDMFKKISKFENNINTYLDKIHDELEKLVNELKEDKKGVFYEKK